MFNCFMKKIFKIEGLDCAVCADKIERKVKEIPGVTSVSVNFLTQKFTLEAPDDLFDKILNDAKILAKKIEANVEIK